MAEGPIPIVQRAYDFAGALYDHVNRFPRAPKPLLGRELAGLALRLLVTLVTANRRRDRVPALEEERWDGRLLGARRLRSGQAARRRLPPGQSTVVRRHL